MKPASCDKSTTNHIHAVGNEAFQIPLRSLSFYATIRNKLPYRQSIVISRCNVFICYQLWQYFWKQLIAFKFTMVAYAFFSLFVYKVRSILEMPLGIVTPVGVIAVFGFLLTKKNSSCPLTFYAPLWFICIQ